MSDNWINTGNDFADSIFYDQFVENPVMLALVDYLIKAQVINKSEFEELANKYCKANSQARAKYSHDFSAPSFQNRD